MSTASRRAHKHIFHFEHIEYVRHNEDVDHVQVYDIQIDHDAVHYYAHNDDEAYDNNDSDDYDYDYNAHNDKMYRRANRGHMWSNDNDDHTNHDQTTPV